MVAYLFSMVHFAEQFCGRKSCCVISCRKFVCVNISFRWMGFEKLIRFCDILLAVDRLGLESRMSLCYVLP